MLSLSFDDGVFSLKLDFAFWRPRAVKPPPALKRALGPRPLPPPFPLPPLRCATPFEVLVEAPALRGSSVVRRYTAFERPLRSDVETRGADQPAEEGCEPTYCPPQTDLAKQRREARRALRELLLY